MRSRRHQARQPRRRQRRRRGRDDEVAESSPLEGLHLGEHDDVREHFAHRRDLPTREGESRAVGDVDQQHAVGTQKTRGGGVELDRRQVRGDLRAGVDVGHQHVDLADQSRGKPAERLARIPDPHADGGAARQRQPLAYEGDQLGLEFDDLLAGAGPRRVDVAGEGHGAGAEVHRGERLPGQLQPVDHGGHPRDVLEVQMRRVIEVDVRLRGPVDDEFVARRVGRRFDGGQRPVAQAHRRFGVLIARAGHVPSLPDARVRVPPVP